MSKQALTKYAMKRIFEPSDKKAMQQPIDQAAQRQEPEIAMHNRKHWWSRKAQADIILSPHERKVLKKVKSRAHFLDRGIHCCCFAVGFDGLVGLIPVVGDFIGVFFAFALIRTASKVDLPSEVLHQMFLNVCIDFVVGLVPVVGDIADIFYKCNTRNAVLLEEYLMTRRRDQMLKDQGKLPADHLVGSGPIPGTENERPKAHQGTPRVQAFDTDSFDNARSNTMKSGKSSANSSRKVVKPMPESSTSKTFKSA
ncbi:hypothetical protein NQZ79_g4140 [Umbelopsis isabellina]|nr:hypothetical protein NQZ79_g4140 [Umbelopsis isabellina]